VRIVGFIWIEEILEKLLRKHNVREHEVVEIFESSPMFRFVENGHREDERVYSARGQTDAGRYVIVLLRSQIRWPGFAGVGPRHDRG